MSDARRPAGTYVPQVAVVNLGCRVNRVESDVIARRLIDAGCEICDERDADVVVINTCAVTGEAQAKARKAVRHAAHLPKAPQVIACGCAANLFAEELREAVPNITVELRKDVVAQRVLDLLGFDDARSAGTSHLAMTPTPTGRMRPGIKIQDGCNNRCTYCIVWKARGPSRSLASSEVVRAVNEACANHAHEVVLSGINLGNYRAPAGDTLGEGAGLDALLDHLLQHTTIERMRIASIEPPEVTDELLDVMADSNGRVAPFLHVCLQSGCDDTLERMGRTYNTAFFADVVARARARLDHVAIGTDVIVGFPGETDEEFEASYAFCEQMQFARMHVFRYSRRPGTPAAEAPNQIPAPEIAARSARMRDLANTLRVQNARPLHGVYDDVLVLSSGRAVDARLFEVKVKPELEPGSMVHVMLKANVEGQLEGFE